MNEKSIKKNSDGSEEKILLPKSDVLLFITECGDKIFIRPSGTEPKVKLYYLASDSSRELVESKIDCYKKDMTAFMA